MVICVSVLLIHWTVWYEFERPQTAAKNSLFNLRLICDNSLLFKSSLCHLSEVGNHGSLFRSFSRQSYTLFITFISPFQNISTPCIPLSSPPSSPCNNNLCFPLPLIKCPNYFNFLSLTVSNNLAITRTVYRVPSRKSYRYLLYPDTTL